MITPVVEKISSKHDWLVNKNLVRDVLRVVKAKCESEHAKMEYQPRLRQSIRLETIM